MSQSEGTAPGVAAEQPADQPLPPRRGRGWVVLGLLGCSGLAFWCHYWLSNAELSTFGSPHADEAGRYTLALLLAAPALGGICVFLNQLWRGRWLLWLALFLLGAEGVVLIGTWYVLRVLGSVSPTLTALLGLGLLGALGAGYYVSRRLRRG